MVFVGRDNHLSDLEETTRSHGVWELSVGACVVTINVGMMLTNISKGLITDANISGLNRTDGSFLNLLWVTRGSVGLLPSWGKRFSTVLIKLMLCQNDLGIFPK